MVLVAAFTLRALKETFFGEAGRSLPGHGNELPNGSATLAEKLGASLLMFATLVVGLDPKLLLDRIMPAIETMRFLQR
jgi:NADH:ubiquinone oxidoreductase subunit 4 (subunit M)